MLESSVRALENHVILASVANSSSRTDDLFSFWHEPILSTVSSSFSSAVSIAAATTPTGGDKRLPSTSGIFVYGERSLPRRHHTIGNIRYDSSAYKTVSFQEDEPKVERGGGAGLFRHMKQEKSDQEIEFDLEEDQLQQTKEISCSDVQENCCSDLESESKVFSPIEDSFEPKSADEDDSSFLTSEQRDAEQDDVAVEVEVVGFQDTLQEVEALLAPSLS